MTILSSEHTLYKYLSRYGVPLIILVYYVTAAERFDYTPESTFATLIGVKEGDASSLWMVLLTLFDSFSLDLLLAAKTLSLLFCSGSLLFMFFVAYEVLRDHLSAFCVTLAISMQAWFLQLGPSGSGVAFALLLSLAALFFMLRNDYLLATVFAAFGGMVAWQLTGLLFVILFDVSINSISKTRSAKVAASIVMVFAGIVLPWVLYGAYTSLLLIPNEIHVSDVPVISPQLSFMTVLLVGLMFVGIVLLATRDRELLRSHSAIVLWTVTVPFLHTIMLAVALPLILTFAFLSLRLIVGMTGFPRAGDAVVVLLATALLAYSQFVSRPPVYDLMDRNISTTAEMKSAGLWLKTHMNDDQTVSVPASYGWAVRFYSEKMIGVSETDFVLSDQSELPGFGVVFEPASDDPHVHAIGQRYKIWRRL
ncbi:MAG: hypothetical protein KF749_09590 [Bacteroidetes bacterium]|nr:hypothetical protein [Bacteroidota bacterium]MCW5894999.1 hypothetical protein [Bacteroidota bacterium]